MKIFNPKGFFDEQQVLDKLTSLGDPLVLINQHIDFTIFKNLLLKIFDRVDNLTPQKGRPSFDLVVMIKIIFVQRLYNLSDEQIEFQINDRMSFRRFLNIPWSNAVPDCKTVWAFREVLKKEDYTEQIFALFLSELESKNLIAKEGKMIDATIVNAPKQRNTREENKEIKNGKTPSGFTEKPNKLAQKDMDARWTMKNNMSYYGYKNHVKGEVKNKFIVKYKVTAASVHDSQVCAILLDENDEGEELYADSAYPTDELEIRIKELSMEGKIIEKAYRNKPLTNEQKANNKTKSKTRARIEHIFGFMHTSMNDAMSTRTIGIERAMVIIGLNNWTYNICRFIQLKKLKLA
jgi:IS5 family transposase